MKHTRTRVCAAGCVAAAAALGAIRLAAQPQAGPRVEISFAPGARTEPVTGMVYLAISRDNQSAPIQQTDSGGVPLFSKYVDQLKPGATVTIGAEDGSHPPASQRDIPAGEYFGQPSVNVSTPF